MLMLLCELPRNHSFYPTNKKKSWILHYLSSEKIDPLFWKHFNHNHSHKLRTCIPANAWSIPLNHKVHQKTFQINLTEFLYHTSELTLHPTFLFRSFNFGYDPHSNCAIHVYFITPLTCFLKCPNFKRESVYLCHHTMLRLFSESILSDQISHKSLTKFKNFTLVIGT